MMGHFLTDIFVDTHITGTESDYECFMSALQSLNNDERTAKAYADSVQRLADSYDLCTTDNKQL